MGKSPPLQRLWGGTWGGRSQALWGGTWGGFSLLAARSDCSDVTCEPSRKAAARRERQPLEVLERTANDYYYRYYRPSIYCQNRLDSFIRTLNHLRSRHRDRGWEAAVGDQGEPPRGGRTAKEKEPSHPSNSPGLCGECRPPRERKPPPHPLPCRRSPGKAAGPCGCHVVVVLNHLCCVLKISSFVGAV